MKILKVDIIRAARNSRSLFQFQDTGSTHFAKCGYDDWNTADMLKKPAVILELNGKFYFLGYDGIAGEGYSEYKAGIFILKYYDNGNLSIYPSANGILGLSILNFTLTSMRLKFNSSISIPVQNLPPNYYVVERGEYTTIELLLPTTLFSALAKIPRGTIRRWKVNGVLLPVTITPTGRAYYSIKQIPLANAIARKRCDSAAIYQIFINKLEDLTPGDVVYISWFKHLIRKYANSSCSYSSLRDLLRELLSNHKLERLKRGYYCKSIAK